jgi:hypothetical protein
MAIRGLTLQPLTAVLFAKSQQNLFRLSKTLIQIKPNVPQQILSLPTQGSCEICTNRHFYLLARD